MMLKLILTLIVAFSLTGCGGNEKLSEEGKFTLTADEKAGYEAKIEETLNSFYWRYDHDSVLYFKENVPDAANEKDKMIFDASSNSGFNLSSYSGKESIVATVRLLHFNGESAGLAYFYFIKKTPIGVYYTGTGGTGRAYSLNDRNIYTAQVSFKGYESEKTLGEFNKKASKFPSNGFCSIGKDKEGNIITAVNEVNKIGIYRYKNGFTRQKTIYIPKDEEIVISASFCDIGTKGNGLAVIVGNSIGFEEDTSEAGYIVSDKVIFYDDNMNKLSNEIILTSGKYRYVGVDGENLVLSNGKVLEYYSGTGDKWSKTDQYYFEHRIIGFKKVDLDGNGEYEYLMTDGLDFYMYVKNDNIYKNVWKTHLSIDSVEKDIYVGDLNFDGVKEIYICDKTGTSIRYTLTEKGLVSRNEDIDYGQCFYVGDFNNDGKDDFIKINDSEGSSQNLYIGI